MATLLRYSGQLNSFLLVENFPVYLLYFIIIHTIRDNFLIFYWISISYIVIYLKLQKVVENLMMTSALCLIYLFLNFESADNHVFLLIWTVLIYTCTSAYHFINVNFIFRIILGVLFISAGTWKLQSPDFFKGSFLIAAVASYENALPEAFSKALFGVNRSDTIDAIEELRLGNREVVSVNVNTSLKFFAQPLSLFVIAFEIFIGLSFIFKFNYAHYALIIFIFATYPLFFVYSFGQVLAFLGIYSIEKEKGSFIKTVYAFLILLMPLLGYIK
jgi:hypothetical protein